MTIVGGADGCRSGWVLITKDIDSGIISAHPCAAALDIFHTEPSLTIAAIDIPIGLTERGARTCDLEARKLLGRGRASSVFPAPIRPVLAAPSYDDACRKRFSAEGKSISRQTWLIVPKVRDVDRLLRHDTELRSKVREVHPEVSFFFMADGRPMRNSKRTMAGKEERRNLLEPIFGKSVQIVLANRKYLACKEDDILDAFATLWTAERIAMGTSQTIPDDPPQDSFGLRMGIVA